jgi:type VI secretion system secreted protein Hcp
MAAVDYFLKIDGIDGESADSKHKGEIDVESWSWGESQAGAAAHGGGGGAGKVSMQDFHFVMKVNKASPRLLLACASGEHIKQAVLTCRKAGKDQQDFLQVRFTDLLVSSYQTAGDVSADAAGTDRVSLNFAKIEMEYWPPSAGGKLGDSVKVGWDLQANQST